MYYYVWFQKEAPITHTKRGKAVPNTKKLFTHLKHEQTLTKGNDFLKLDKVACTHICSILPFAQTEIHCCTLQFVVSNTSSIYYSKLFSLLQWILISSGWDENTSLFLSNHEVTRTKSRHLSPIREVTISEAAASICFRTSCGSFLNDMRENTLPKTAKQQQLNRERQQMPISLE